MSGCGGGWRAERVDNNSNNSNDTTHTPDTPHRVAGTMLFGESQDYASAAQLLDACMAARVNFFDTAEMYPVPQRAETQGASEAFLGRWMRERNNRWAQCACCWWAHSERKAGAHAPAQQKRWGRLCAAAGVSQPTPAWPLHQHRHDVIVASKVCGPSGQMTWIRGGPHRLDAANIRAALDASLARLQTDCIDLYQLHWPDRCVLSTHARARACVCVCVYVQFMAPVRDAHSRPRPPPHTRACRRYVPMFGDVDYDPTRAYAVSEWGCSRARADRAPLRGGGRAAATTAPWCAARRRPAHNPILQPTATRRPRHWRSSWRRWAGRWQRARCATWD
jgi:hypothetical protein